MWHLKPPPGLPRTGCVCLHSWVLPNYGSTDREPPEPAEPVELVEPVKPVKPVAPGNLGTCGTWEPVEPGNLWNLGTWEPVEPGNLWNLGTCGTCGTCWSIHFFVKKKNAIDFFNDISYACTSTMNVATIEVGHQGQLKHIYLLKCSSLYPKTNFQTVLRSF